MYRMFKPLLGITLLFFSLQLSALPDEAKSAVVMININHQARNSIDFRGAGVIVKIDKQAVFIVTRHHVIEPLLEQAMGYVGYLRLHSSSAIDRRFSILKSDEAADLALISLPLKDNPDIDVNQLSAALLDVDFISGALITVGQGGARPWATSRSADTTGRLLPGDNEIAFAGAFVEEGDSGGGVFIDNGKLVGIYRGRENSDYVVATSSKRVLAFLKDAGVVYEANEAARCLYGLHNLQEAGLALTVESLAQSMATADLGALKKFEEACLSTPMLEAAMQFESRPKEAAFTLMAEAKNYRQELAAWLSRMIKRGLNPDLQVLGNAYPRHSLLSIAFVTANYDFIMALLKGGAAPNPYYDEYLAPTHDTRFLFPLLEIHENKTLTQQEKSTIIRTLIERGVFVPTGSTEQLLFASGSISSAGKNYQIYLKYADQSKKTKPNPVCSNSDNSWCRNESTGELGLPRLLFSSNQRGALEDLRFGPLLAFDDQYGYYAVSSSQFVLPAKGIRAVRVLDDWGVALVNRDATSIRIRRYMEGFVAGGLCKSYGSSRSPKRCWRDLTLEKNSQNKQWQLRHGQLTLEENHNPNNYAALKQAANRGLQKATSKRLRQLGRQQRKCAELILDETSLLEMVMATANRTATPRGRMAQHSQFYRSYPGYKLLRRSDSFAPLKIINELNDLAIASCQ